MTITYKNELIKKRFFSYLKNSSRGFSEKSIDCYNKAILLWQNFSNDADFIYLNEELATSFKNWLKNKKKVNSQDNISLSYQYDILRYLRVFFEWLSEQKGYKKSKIKSSVDFLNLSKAERTMATQPRNKKFPSTEEVKNVLENIKGKSETEMRDKALISLIFLTGARISAIMTLPMKCFDKDKRTIDQDPTLLKVKTKFSKRIVSTFISFSYKEPINYFLDWVDYLEKKRQFKPNDPIFPATKIENGKENLSYYNTGQVEPKFWESTSSPRKVFKKWFEQVGIKPDNPHALRHLLVSEARKRYLTEEQKKAISQNFGHADVETTFGSRGYGEIPDNGHIEIIKNIDFEGQNKEPKYQLINRDDLKEDLKQVLKEIGDDKD